ncbi:MAG TPA: hypothetical protein PLL15_06150 [Syntrophales bacterium]|nr:hypothetical protein [Syntrophales bacterium]
MINGCQYDWESVTIVMQSGVAIGITNISYKDERPVEPRYGKGSVPRGYGRKNYKADGSMELDLLEAELLQAALGMSYYKAQPFPIIVKYANQDQPIVVDTLPDCKITKVDTSAKQGDEVVGVRKFDFVILSPIKWGDVGALDAIGEFLKEKVTL